MPTATVEKKIIIAGETVSSSKSYTDTATIVIDEAIADSASDDEVALVLDVTQITAWYMVSDQVLTVETNDGTTPADTFTLAANVPLVWTSDDGTANPLTTDVTALFLSNSSGSTANFKFRALYDSTV